MRHLLDNYYHDFEGYSRVSAREYCTNVQITYACFSLVDESYVLPCRPLHRLKSLDEDDDDETDSDMRFYAGVRVVRKVSKDVGGRIEAVGVCVKPKQL
jgi:hypothetical protein